MSEPIRERVTILRVSLPAPGFLGWRRIFPNALAGIKEERHRQVQTLGRGPGYERPAAKAQCTSFPIFRVPAPGDFSALQSPAIKLFLIGLRAPATVGLKLLI